MSKSCADVRWDVIAAVSCIVALLGGCSYTVMPKNISLNSVSKTGSLAGVSLFVISAEKDSTDYAIPTDTGGISALRANRQTWSTMLVEVLASELAKRGARVSTKAPLAINLTLPEIIFAQNKDVFQLSVKILVFSSAGWQKNYKGVAESGAESFESVSTMVNRLAGQALAEAVKAMLGDPDFLAQVRGK